MRRIRNVIIACLLVAGLLAAGFVLGRRAFYVAPILMYHHVATTATPEPNTVSPERFAWHMAYLKKHDFRVIPLDHLVGMVHSGQAVPANTVAITFDDGNEDNYTGAFPVLQGQQFPATFFVSSDLVNTPGYVSTAQMQEMIDGGIEIGSHTRRHSYLPGLSPDQQKDEIFESKRRLEEILGVEVAYFAYPSGGFTGGIKQMVKDAGYKGACTTNRGRDKFNRDVYELNRIRLSDKDDRLDYVWMKLTGVYNLFRKNKNSH
jgi:peptidoglycan/xylan/chitin deacetylase (PgdA/CDA1 family)